MHTRDCRWGLESGNHDGEFPERTYYESILSDNIMILNPFPFQFVATDEESVQQQLREEMMHSDIRSCPSSLTSRPQGDRWETADLPDA